MISIFAITQRPSVFSIPICLLQSTLMKTSQKFSLAVFLCGSILIAIVAIVRVAGYHINGGTVDVTWQAFWIYVETAIAMIMVSLSAFRSLLVNRSPRPSDEKRRWPMHPFRNGLLRKSKRSDKSEWEDAGHGNLPEIPSATFTGIRTFIRRNNRSAGATTAMQSEVDSLNEERMPYPSYLSSPNIIQMQDRWNMRSSRVSFTHSCNVTMTS